MEPSTEQIVSLLIAAAIVYIGYTLGDKMNEGGNTGKIVGAAAGGMLAYYAYVNQWFPHIAPSPVHATVHY